MQKIFVLAFALLLLGSSQPLLAQKDTLQESIERGMRSMDSLNEQIRVMDSINTARMMQKSTENMTQNVDWILRLQDENRRKEKKKAIMYIAMGVVFAAVLVVGLLRRRKKNNV